MFKWRNTREKKFWERRKERDLPDFKMYYKAAVIKAV